MALVGPTLVLYAVVGIGVAIAVYLSGRRADSAGVWFRVATAMPFWPLYIPVLLTRAYAPGVARASFGQGHGQGHGLGQGKVDDMSAAISQIDAELVAETPGAGCQHCSGRLHTADFPRKPRGLPGG